MRWVSLLTALCVGLFLYGLVFERDALRALAGAGDEATDAPTEAASTMTEPVGGPIAVVAVHSVEQDVRSGVVLRGRTEAFRRVEVRAETTGQVISEPLRRGAVVSEGDLLCEIDPGSRLAQLAEAEARLAEAVANNSASESLVERGFTSETVAIANRASLQSAQAAIEAARIEIGRLEIRAPFDGILESDSAEIGSLLQPGLPCATVIDLDPIKLIGFVPEGDVDRVAAGADVSARLLTGLEFAGEVTFVSRSADPDTRTFRVEAEIPNPDRLIRDGITAELLVSLEDARAHLLPQSALTLDDGGALGVRVADGGRAQFVEVTVVRDTPEGIYLSGLPANADVIVVGQDLVTDGQEIAVTYQEPKS